MVFNFLRRLLRRIDVVPSWTCAYCEKSEDETLWLSRSRSDPTICNYCEDIISRAAKKKKKKIADMAAIIAGEMLIAGSAAGMTDREIRDKAVEAAEAIYRKVFSA